MLCESSSATRLSVLCIKVYTKDGSKRRVSTVFVEYRQQTVGRKLACSLGCTLRRQCQSCQSNKQHNLNATVHNVSFSDNAIAGEHLVPCDEQQESNEQRAREEKSETGVRLARLGTGSDLHWSPNMLLYSHAFREKYSKKRNISFHSISNA